MGSTTVSRRAFVNTEAEVRAWIKSETADQGYRDGHDSYSGNWTCNSGITIVPQSFKTDDEAAKYANTRLNKRGPIMAMRVGDFKQAFPGTKAEQALLEKVTELEKECNEFDWHIVDRVKKAKSKTRKCPHCESGISVAHLHLPSLKDWNESNKGTFSICDIPALFWHCGKRLTASIYELTACPVCNHNLLRTDTDAKNLASLQKRKKEAFAKLEDAKAKYKAKMSGKQEPHWYVTAECAC